MSGLCAEGRFELAMDAIRSLDVGAVLDRAPIATAAKPSDERVRRLGPEDAASLRPLRLRALREEPHAFLMSEAEQAQDSVEVFAERLAQPADRASTIGAFVDGELVAMAGVVRMAREKIRHRAMIWGVYVAPEHRGQGLGRAVVAACVDAARVMGVEIVALSVEATNAPAIATYRALGFAPWGHEPDAYRVHGERSDELHMSRRLDA